MVSKGTEEGPSPPTVHSNPVFNPKQPGGENCLSLEDQGLMEEVSSKLGLESPLEFGQKRQQKHRCCSQGDGVCVEGVDAT